MLIHPELTTFTARGVLSGTPPLAGLREARALPVETLPLAQVRFHIDPFTLDSTKMTVNNNIGIQEHLSAKFLAKALQSAMMYTEEIHNSWMIMRFEALGRLAIVASSGKIKSRALHSVWNNKYSALHFGGAHLSNWKSSVPQSYKRNLNLQEIYPEFHQNIIRYGN